MVTEITYHRDEKIAADIHFLSLEQWKEEVSLCLQDAVARDDDSDADSDADEPMEAPLDAHSPAGIAWQKVSVPPLLQYINETDTALRSMLCIPSSGSRTSAG